MSEILRAEGVISKVYTHEGDRYGLKLVNDERWFNGFKVPKHLCEGVMVVIEYVEKPGVDCMYYNVVSITDNMKVHTQGCPHCGGNIFFTVNR